MDVSGRGRLAGRPRRRGADGAGGAAVPRTPAKLALARRMKADAVVDAAQEDLVAAVRAATAGRGADVVIDAAGAPALLAPALEMLAPGGPLLVSGISHRPVPDFTTYPLYFKELTL